MKNILHFAITLLLTLVAMVMVTSCSSDDYEVVFGSGLIGKWRLSEIQNRPAGIGSTEPYVVEIKETDSQQNYMKRIGGTYTVKYDEGGLEVFYWSIPSKTDTLYHTNYPVFCIHYVGKDYPGEPYAYEVGSTTLKLRHLGRNNTDPVSETLIYKRIK